MSTASDLNIRPATATDIPAVLDLYCQAGLDENSLPLKEAIAQWRIICSYPCYVIYVALQEGQIVGTFALLIMENLLHGGQPSGIVESVAVHPAMQGQGIGRAMMQAAMCRCQERNCYKLTISANAIRTQAHQFYEGLGFQKHGYSFHLEFSPDEVDLL
jgi:GNAT superfamily N-acetyltransferase